MSSLELSDYPALNLSGDNYLEWVGNTLKAMRSGSLGKCLYVHFDDIPMSAMDRAKMIIRLHIAEELRDQYQYVGDSNSLWLELKHMFKPVLQQKAKDKWETIRFQDFESVENYHHALMEIVHGLELCDEIITNEDLLYKTCSTLHPEDVLLFHRAKEFTTYDDLLWYLLALKILSSKWSMSL